MQLQNFLGTRFPAQDPPLFAGLPTTARDFDSTLDDALQIAQREVQDDPRNQHNTQEMSFNKEYTATVEAEQTTPAPRLTKAYQESEQDENIKRFNGRVLTRQGDTLSSRTSPSTFARPAPGLPGTSASSTPRLSPSLPRPLPLTRPPPEPPPVAREVLDLNVKTQTHSPLLTPPSRARTYTTSPPSSRPPPEPPPRLITN